MKIVDAKRLAVVVGRVAITVYVSSNRTYVLLFERVPLYLSLSLYLIASNAYAVLR